MADMTLRQDQGVPRDMMTRYLDLGDGTHALVKDAGVRSGQTFRAVTPSDVADLPDGVTRGIYVGATGNLVVHDTEGHPVIFVDVAAGIVHPLAIRRVLTASTATDIVAIY